MQGRETQQRADDDGAITVARHRRRDMQAFYVNPQGSTNVSDRGRMEADLVPGSYLGNRIGGAAAGSRWA